MAARSAPVVEANDLTAEAVALVRGRDLAQRVLQHHAAAREHRDIRDPAEHGLPDHLEPTGLPRVR